MAGINNTGKANPNDYNLGRGKLFFIEPSESALDAAYRDLGNCTEFNITVDSETLEHQSSLEALKKVDKEVILSQAISISASLDELNFENLSAFLSGEYKGSSAGIVNATRFFSVNGGGSPTTVTLDLNNVPLGRWIDLEEPVTGLRFYDLDDPTKGLTPDRTRYDTGNNKEQVICTLDPGGAATPLVRDTDFEVDWVMGRVFFLPAGAVTLGADVDVTIFQHEGDGGAAGPLPANLDSVKALTTGSYSGKLKFIAENPANDDHQTEYQFFSVTLKAEGDLAAIGDEFSTLTLTGSAESDSSGGVHNGKTLELVTHSGESQPSS